MKKVNDKNGWILLLFILAGIVLGGFLASLTQNVAGFSWLSFGQSFGLDSPLVLNLGILVLTFGLTIHINIGSIIGIIAATIVYRFI